MIQGQGIICITQDWQGDPTSKKHIMRILSKQNRVIWVNSIGVRRPTVSAYDLHRIVYKLRRIVSGCREVEPNIFVLDPPVLPLPGVVLAERLNRFILAARLRQLCRRLGMDRPLLWTFQPNVNWLLGSLNERLVIYHCVDDHSELPGVSKEVIAGMERDLVRQADIVLTTAEKLCAERREINPRTYFIPHGVDAAHFSRALDPKTAVASEIRTLPKPVIGFFGLLADWVDLDMIGALARARPKWSFALVGKAQTDLHAVQGLSNVHLIGQRPYSALPGYCRGFDVGVIPFRMNELTLRVNPLKLREYLAAGLPVVSTPLPEVVRYQGVVHIATNREGFLEEIEAALKERTSEGDRARVTMMQSEGWEARVDEMSRLVEERLMETA
ncbi:MAG: glycosyl transferase [Nitrospira sp.]|nr:glycosyl transferase [Nitrospira sp.]